MISNVININVTEDCIPITINGIDFSFDTKEENLVRFTNIEEYIDQRLQADRDNESLEKLEEMDEKEKFIWFVDRKKKELEIYYEVVLGPGSFEKLYALNLGVSRLEDVATDLSGQIAKQIVKKAKDKENKEAMLRKKYLKKKKK